MAASRGVVPLALGPRVLFSTALAICLFVYVQSDGALAAVLGLATPSKGRLAVFFAGRIEDATASSRGVFSAKAVAAFRHVSEAPTAKGRVRPSLTAIR